MLFNYAICTPIYNKNSAGVCVLHKLANELNVQGRKCIIIFMVKKNDGYNLFYYHEKNKVNESYFNKNFKYFFIKQDELKSFLNNSIVIYPEVITDNPLNAKYICRYMLNKEGAIIKNKKINFLKNDFILSHSKNYHKKFNFLLFFDILDPNLPIMDNQYASQLRKIDATYIGKGSKDEDCKVIENTIEITRSWPNNKIELYKVLSNVRYFYTYDNFSLLNLEAIICGCIPIFLSKKAAPDLIMNDYDITFPDEHFKLPSLQDNFHDLKKIRDKILNKLITFHEDYPKKVNLFINKIENHFLKLNND